MSMSFEQVATLSNNMPPNVYKATYSQVEVYESLFNSTPLMRRCDDDWVNATQIMKIAGYAKAQRTRILEREVHSLTHRKIQGGHGKFQGTWVPLQFARELALKHGIDSANVPVLYFDPRDAAEIPNISKGYRGKNDTNSVKRPAVNDYKQQNKLSSPEKSKRDKLNLQHSNSFNLPTKNLPPTFGMYTERPGKNHMKSKSFSNLPTQRNPVRVPMQPLSADTHNHPLPNNQFEVQQELQSIQFQQQQHQHHQQQNQHQQQQQHHIQQQQRYIQQQYSHPSSDNFNPTPTPPVYTKNMYPLFENSPEQKYQDQNSHPMLEIHDIHEQHNVQNIYQTPHYKQHQRHHSSPQKLQTAKNTQMNSFHDNQEYYTTELLNFIVHGTQIPDFLINKPIDFDINKPLDEEGHTPLHWAAALGSAEIIKLLIDNDANILLTNNQGMNPLSKLVKYMNSYDLQNFPVILTLLKDCLVVPDFNKRTPLHYLMEIYFEENKMESTRYYFYEIIQFVNIQQQNAESFNSTIHKEIKNRRILQLLLNHKDINGETALHIALKTRNREFTIQLLKFGADTDLVDIPVPQDIIKEVNAEASFSESMNLSVDMNMSMMSNHGMHIPNDDVYQTSFIQPVDSNNLISPSKRLIGEPENPFLVPDFKDSPQTIVTQQTPEQFDDRVVEKDVFEISKKSSSPERDSVGDHTFVDKSMIVDPVDVNDNNEVDPELLVVKPSGINEVELDEFVKSLPSKVASLKSNLEYKTDTLNHNIETINKLNTEITSLTNKNYRLVKKIHKLASPTSPSINLTQLAENEVKVFVDDNVAKFTHSLTEKRFKLLNIYERSQALEVAKLVNSEEEKITRSDISSSEKDDKLKSAVKLSMMQIMRRQIMEQMLQMYLKQGSSEVYNDDFTFDEDVIGEDGKGEGYRNMKSKVEVYKKLISRICHLEVGEINADLLAEIEKTLS